MIKESTPPFAIWGLCFAVLLGSVAISYYKIGALPLLDFSVDNHLVVRAVEITENEKNAKQIILGDQIVSLGGYRVKTLSDFSSILSGEKGVGEIDVQFVRPVYTFNVDVRGAKVGDLPGVLPTDLLWEVDGRRFLEPISYEGLGSIISHRPDAVLGFERRDALFQSTILSRKPIRRLSFLLLFLLSAAFSLFLFFSKHERVNPIFGVSTAFGGVFLAWAFLFAVEYQWVQAEPIIGICVTLGLLLSRPLAMFAWRVVRENERGKWNALLLATSIGVTLSIIGFLDLIAWEFIFQISGSIAAAFVVYESLLIFIAPSRSTFGDRGIYLVGVVSIILVSAFALYISDKGLFLGKYWPWFVATMLLLVWFQDFVFAIRGPETTGIAAISSAEDRDERIAEYLRSIGDQLGEASVNLCVLTKDETTVFEYKRNQVHRRGASSELHDALSILTEEQTEIPLVEGVNALMEGIAKSMNIIAAAEITAPLSSLVVEGVKVVFVAFNPRSGQTPRYASVDTLNLVRWSMNAVIWSALIVDSLKERSGKKNNLLQEERTKIKRLEAKNQKLQAEIENSSERSSLLQKDTLELNSIVRFFSEQNQHAFFNALEDLDQLVEKGLIRSVEYLLESDEAIVIAGARGTGKTFVGMCAHHFDPIYSGPLSVLDTVDFVSHIGSADHLAEGAKEAVEGGTMIVRNASLLTHRLLEELLETSRGHFRLILCYSDKDAMEVTVLEKLPDNLREVLEERELVIPNFEDRTSIKRAVMMHLMENAAIAQKRDMLGFSKNAWVDLEAYSFSGNIIEAKRVIEEAVAISTGEVIESSDVFGS